MHTTTRPLVSLALGACLALTALSASAQQDLSCAQIAAELKSLQAAPAANAQADAAAATAGAQVLGALAQQAAARSGAGSGLGGMFGGLMGGGAARPATQVQAAQAVQLLAVAQAVQGGGTGQPADGAQVAQVTQNAAVQAAAAQALAQQRGAGAISGGQAAQVAGVMGLLGGLMSAAQAQAPVATPGNAAITELAGSRQEQLGGLFLAKGCKSPG